MSTSELTIGPCVVCGQSIHYAPGEFAEMAERQAHLREHSPALARVVLGLARSLTCATCLQLADVTRARLRDQNRKREAQRSAIDYVRRNELYAGEYLDQTFADAVTSQRMHTPDVWAFAEMWTPTNQNLWICGETGRGKTYIAHAIMNRVLESGHTVAHLSCASLHEEMRPFAFADNHLPKLRAVHVLLLDDMDKTRGADALNILWGILDYRNNHGLRTLITSNFTADAFRKNVLSTMTDKNATFPKTFMERLHWPGVICKTLQLRGPSMRRPVAQEQTEIPETKPEEETK